MMLLMLFWLGSATASAGNDPEDVVRDFYGWALTGYTWGVPSNLELQKLAGVLAPELIDLMLETNRLQKICGNLMPPDMKAQVLENNLFSSEYEGAAEIYVEESVGSVDRANVEV